MGDGYGELLIFDVNSPIFSEVEVCVLHDVKLHKAECSMPRLIAGRSNRLIAGRSNCVEIHNACRSEQTEAQTNEGSLLDITCATDMPAALETALDDPNFLVCCKILLLI